MNLACRSITLLRSTTVQHNSQSRVLYPNSSSIPFIHYTFISHLIQQHSSLYCSIMLNHYCLLFKLLSLHSSQTYLVSPCPPPSFPGLYTLFATFSSFIRFTCPKHLKTRLSTLPDTSTSTSTFLLIYLFLMLCLTFTSHKVIKYFI